MFSIVMPLHNKRAYVAATLQTVIDQRFEDWELVVIDDGSTDDSATLVAAVEDPRVRLIRQLNIGVGPTRNRAIELCRSEWIAFIDADDLWLPCHLDELDRIRRHFPEAGLIGTSFVDSDPDGRFTLPSREDEREPALTSYFDAVARGENVLNSSTAAIPRRSYDALGGFISARGEDMEYWARIALSAAVATSPRTTAIYIHGTGGIHDSSRDGWRGIRRLEELSPASALLIAHQDRSEPKQRRDDIECYIEWDLGWCLKTLFANGDFRTARRLFRLYRRRPPLDHLLIIGLSYLPMKLARLAHAVEWRINGALRRRRLPAR